MVEKKLASTGQYLQQSAEKTMNKVIEMQRRNRPLYEQMQGNVKENWQRIKGGTQQGLQQLGNRTNDGVMTLKAGTQQGLAGLRQNTRQSMSQLRKKTDDMRVYLRECQTLRQQQRHREQRTFQWGLLVGIMLAFCLTPWTGKEVRRRLIDRFQTYRETLTHT
jgi:gas vesicle protein